MLEYSLAEGVVEEAGRNGGAAAGFVSGGGEVVAADGSLEGLSAAEVVRRVSDGRVKSEMLPAELRQECVGYLTAEGFNSEEIAEMMKVCPRTVHRDRLALRRSGAVGPGAALGDELFGELERAAMASVQRLVRMTKDRETPAYARLWAEKAIVENLQRVLETASRMRYVEDGARRLRAAREHPEDRKLRELEEEKERNRIAWELVPEEMRQKQWELKQAARAARKAEIAREKKRKAREAEKREKEEEVKKGD